MSKDNVTRRISIFVNGKEVENSLKGVEGAMSQVRNRMRLLNTDSETYDKDSKELAKTMTDLRERQAQYRDELGLTSQSMKDAGEMAGGLRGSLTGIWDSLVTGDLQGAKEGISSIGSGLTGLVKSSLAFIATPIGAAIAGLAGLAAGAKALFDYNQELSKMNTELKALGVNAQELSKVRDEISATAETFDKDFKEIATAASSLSKTYGISMSEANKIISDGLAEGGAQNSEFLDSLSEYDSFFASAGYSAQEFKDIVNTGYEFGVYTDKLPDALKEADLALKENTKSTRDALVNAFGASFSDEILNKVKTGELTTKQALEQIALKAKESNLSQQQYAQLTADVFKGAGEDAGGAQKIFELLGASAKRETDKIGNSYKELTQANERLNKAQSDLFEIKGFGDIWTIIKAKATDTLASILEWISEVKKDIQPLIDFVGVVFANAWEGLKLTVSNAFSFISGILRGFGVYFSTVFGFIKKILTGDFAGALDVLRSGFLKLGNIVGDTFGKIKNNILSALQAILTNVKPFLEAIGFDVDKINKKLESFKNKEVQVKSKVVEEKVVSQQTNFGSGGGGASADALKAQQEANAKAQKASEDAAAKKKADEEKAAKESYDLAKNLADARANLAKAQLNQYVAGLRENLIKEKELTPEILALNEDRLDSIKNAQIEFNNNELARKIADLEAKQELEKSSIAVLNLEKEALNLEYQEKNKQLELDFLALTDAEKKIYLEQQKILQAEQLLADNELAIAEADTKFEADKIKQEIAYTAEKAGYAKMLADKKITQEEYDRFMVAAKDNQDKLDRQRDLQSVQNTLQGMSSVADALGQMFGQSKGLAIVQAGINGALAVTSILSAASMGNPILDAVVKGVQIAATVATTVSQISQIKSAKAPKSPKFFYGGNTGTNAALGYDEFGPVTGYVHKNEYVIPEVMTQDPRFANTIGWLEANRQQKLRGYVDGGTTSPGVVSKNTNTQADIENSQLISVLNQLSAILSSGIIAKLFLGYKDVEEIEKMKNELNNSSKNGTIE